MPGGRWFALVRIAVTAAATFFVALVSAVALGLVDLYLTGHSLPSLDRPWISIPSLGIAMSRSDVWLLAAVLFAAVAAWLLTGWVHRVMAPKGLPPSVSQNR